jgi:hypothetical protein
MVHGVRLQPPKHSPCIWRADAYDSKDSVTQKQALHCQVKSYNFVCYRVHSKKQNLCKN